MKQHPTHANYSTASEIISGHRAETPSLHLVRRLANRGHLHRLGFFPEAFHEPHEVAVAHESVAVQPQSRHRADIAKRISRHVMQPIIVKEKPLERRQIAESTLLDLRQLVVMKIELLQFREVLERTRLDARDAVLVEIEDTNVRGAVEGATGQVSKAIVVQQQGVQMSQAVEAAWSDVTDVVEPQVPEETFFYCSTLYLVLIGCFELLEYFK